MGAMQSPLRIRSSVGAMQSPAHCKKMIIIVLCIREKTICIPSRLEIFWGGSSPIHKP